MSHATDATDEKGYRFLLMFLAGGALRKRTHPKPRPNFTKQIMLRPVSKIPTAALANHKPI